jgi:DNA-binding MarR family transcriptional regulator/GNAT superfamily N-acetyltransferase
MPSTPASIVDRIRSASRQMVRELGFMQSTLAATDYPPSAVHAILEIGAQRTLTAVQLGEVLGLEKSSVSRMVRKLVDAGELQESASGDDGRVKYLALTALGKRSLKSIHTYGRKQVSGALAQLTEAQQQAVAEGLAAYAQALQARRTGIPLAAGSALQTVQGYQPGAIGRITEMHARYYSRSVGFGAYFESLVASGLAEFSARLESPRNGLWLALHAGRIVGSVAVDGEDLGANTAHLRWFIVDDGLRGMGAGRQLLAEAVAFCDRQAFAETHLWTFRGLDAARKLYEDCGFTLAEQRPGQQWGTQVVEQRFVRRLPAHESS